MAHDELPFEDIYTEESDLNFEGVLYKEASGGWSPSMDIDWEQDIQVSAEERDALADAATQFHYSNASHLMLCGRLLEHADDMDIKKLALFLAFAKMRNVDAWGRYLGRVSAPTEIAPQTKELLSKMSADENLYTLLLGMGVLGGTVGYGVLDKMREIEEPLFRQIADHIREQKRHNEDLLVHYLEDLVIAADDQETEEIREQAAYFRDRSEQIVLFHGDLLETLGIDPREVADHVLELTDEFYDKVGIEL